MPSQVARELRDRYGFLSVRCDFANQDGTLDSFFVSHENQVRYLVPFDALHLISESLVHDGLTDRYAAAAKCFED